MNIIILYFSQTGNTRTIAEAMSAEFQKCGHHAISLPITKGTETNFTKYDLIGFGTPTFESHAPTPMKEFLKSLPNLSGKSTFLFATGGGAFGSVISDMAKIVEKKDASIIDSFLSLGEMYHPAPCIVGKSGGHPNREDRESAKEFVSDINKRLSFPSKVEYNGLKPKKGFYTLVGKIASSEHLIRFLEPKPKLDKAKCKQCKKCLKGCPMGNIEMKLYPKIGKECIRCYRCLTSCSSEAYSVNWFLGNMVVFSLWNRHFMKLFGEYKGEE